MVALLAIVLVAFVSQAFGMTDVDTAYGWNSLGFRYGAGFYKPMAKHYAYDSAYGYMYGTNPYLARFYR